jgi:hypothetical protein
VSGLWRKVARRLVSVLPMRNVGAGNLAELAETVIAAGIIMFGILVALLVVMIPVMTVVAIISDALGGP